MRNIHCVIEALITKSYITKFAKQELISRVLM